MMEYRENTAAERDITEHFLACDPTFLRHLQSRVDVSAYARKIAERAWRYEAWDGNRLIGLVAAYHNEDPAVFDFITSVSVLPCFLRQGIGSRLLKSCLSRWQTSRSEELRLEVGEENAAARSLYELNGFTKSEDRRILFLRKS